MFQGDSAQTNAFQQAALLLQRTAVTFVAPLFSRAQRNPILKSRTAQSIIAIVNTLVSRRQTKPRSSVGFVTSVRSVANKISIVKRAAMSNVGKINSNTNRQGMVKQRLVSSFVTLIHSITTAHSVKRRTSTTFLPQLQSISNRIKGVAQRTAVAHVVQLLGFGQRVSNKNRTTTSHVNLIHTNAKRAADKVRNATSYVEFATSLSNRVQVSIRKSKAEVEPLFSVSSRTQKAVRTSNAWIREIYAELHGVFPGAALVRTSVAWLDNVYSEASKTNLNNRNGVSFVGELFAFAIRNLRSVRYVEETAGSITGNATRITTKIRTAETFVKQTDSAASIKAKRVPIRPLPKFAWTFRVAPKQRIYLDIENKRAIKTAIDAKTSVIVSN